MNLTRKELDEELAEKLADVQALTEARDILWNRCVSVRDNSKSQLMKFHDWAGTHALMNSLDVFINNANRVVDELKAVRDETPEVPRLTLVRDNE